MKSSPEFLHGTTIPRTITTDNSMEFNEVVARAIRKEFRLISWEAGETNSQWIFTLGRPYLKQEKLEL